MPVNPDAKIEISALQWVPDVGRGLVRDIRVRWALEEAGLDYRERLFDVTQPKPEEYLQEQPFNQVPIFVEDDIQMFETGAIILHLGERCETLLPRDPAGRARATCWMFAALNTIEPPLMELSTIDLFAPDAEWSKLRRPQVVARIQDRLGRVSAWLGERDYLEADFTAGDLLMTTMLRVLRHTDLVAQYPSLVRYQARCEARPAFQRALADQLATFDRHPAPGGGLPLAR